MSYNDLTEESVKPELNIFAISEPNHENPPFPINNEKDVTTRLNQCFQCYLGSQTSRYPQQNTDMDTKIHEGSQQRLY